MKYRVVYETGPKKGFNFKAQDNENAIEIAKISESHFSEILFLDRIEEIRIYNRSD
ncbi:MAG: hypothetical protein WC917_04940 [Bacilli bacterium]|jgi:hypothetical protein